MGFCYDQGVGEAIGKKTLKKEKKIKVTSVRAKRALDTLRGQKVIGRNEVDGYYYPGNCDSSVSADPTVNILYNKIHFLKLLILLYFHA